METVNFTFMPGDRIWAVIKSTDPYTEAYSISGPLECIGTQVILRKNGLDRSYTALIKQAESVCLDENSAHVTPGDAVYALEQIILSEPIEPPVRPYSVDFTFTPDQRVYGLKDNSIIPGTVRYCEYRSYFSRTNSLVTVVTYVVESVKDDSRLIGFTFSDLFTTIEDAMQELNNRIGEQ